MAKFPETKWKAEKESAIAYFNKNGAPQTLEALLNKLALIKPDDLYGYMVRVIDIILLLHNSYANNYFIDA